MSEPIHVTDETFESEVLDSPVPVLVDFWAVWCAPCRAIAPIFETLSSEYEGKVKFAKLNVDENMKVPSTYGIRGIPTVIAFKGGRIANQLVGSAPKNEYVKMISSLV